MEINLKPNIKSFLDALEPLAPIKTELEPYCITDKGVKAVIFDIYGTLLISSSGDIDQANLQEGNICKALETADFELNNNVETSLVFNFILTQLPEVVKKHQEKLKEKGHPYPDVDIIAVWQEIVENAVAKDFIKPDKGSLLDLIIAFEILSNKVYPMPDMLEILNFLRDKNIPIGIVSNAQFYTPIIVNYFIGGKLDTKQQVTGVDPELTAFSFKELRAKPDVKLFDVLIPTMRNLYGILPEEAIFVGNDMLKDIYTATQAGMKTVLFAGDQRSLRLREDDNRTKFLRPDYIITELLQLKQILA